ncbi:MAG: arsenite methyltransferase [Bacteroidetes bacterium]|jgi:SAM-dependent methyltransferase|nr:arsenite methyltransferase [Bacteroidota bacterium]
MKASDELKKIVRDKYAEIAIDKDGGCCKPGCCDQSYSIFSESYETQKGYVKDADLGLGCGIPTDYTRLQEGESVLDLGSGAGNDCFVARSIVGETGQITGIDFTDEMIAKANANKQKLGYHNVEFVKGDIEDMPLPDHSYDVVISNCVLNLVPDKVNAFLEIKRVLKNGGRFCVSDIVLQGQLPNNVREAAAMYAGCVSGALQQDDYIGIIRQTGFRDITIEKSRLLDMPDNLLLEYITKEELEQYRNQGSGIYSITVTGSNKGA